MNRLQKKVRKTSLFGHFGAKREFFSKKGLGNFFRTYITNCKISEKSNERILRYRVKDERMNERT